MNGPRRAPPIYEFGGFHLDTGRRQLRSPQGELATLPANVFDILQYLVEHYGQLVEKSALMKAAWPNVIVEEGNLSQGIFLLRRALGERAGEDRFIMTVPGRGFRFVAPVALMAPASPAPGSAPVSKPDLPRIAVLPFENLSPDPSNAFFADGLHDEILATLAQRAPGLQVISRTTMMRYRAHPAPVPQIAAELGVSHVIEGTVRREADQVRVTLQLIDACQDRQLWSHSYVRTLSSALTLQCEVAGEVASRLAARFLGDNVAAPTHNPEAYDLYLRSRLLSQMVTTLSPPEHWAEPDVLVSRAIELDPDFAIAYAHRAQFCVIRFAFNYDNSEAAINRTRADLASAKRLAPRDPLVLAAEGVHLTWIERDLPRALEKFQAAADVGLMDSMMLIRHSVLLERLGRYDEAHAILERALALDPANPFLLASASLQLGWFRADEAIRLAERAIALYPERPFLRLVRAQVIFHSSGRMDELQRELASAGRYLPPAFLLDLYFPVLVSQRAYGELQALIDAIPESEIRAVPGTGGGGTMFGVGVRPLAQFRGWLALARGNFPDAARYGAEVLEFVARQKMSVHNDWFLHLLNADGYLMSDQREQSIAAARAAMECMPISRDRFGSYVATRAAFNLAWCGATDEGLTILETLQGCGELYVPIFLDPAFFSVLVGDARFQSLKERFENELRSDSAR
jgi:TolB-like protein